MDAGALETFAGTDKQASQRLVPSEVACRPDWVYVAVDVVMGFLQGMTYAEMHELTGEAPLEVNFTLLRAVQQYFAKYPVTRRSTSGRSACTASNRELGARTHPGPSL